MSIKYRVSATLALFQNSLIFHMLKLSISWT
nr:MAG TPA: hypothetical protein [Caudoviricetes sp.]